MFDLTPPVNVCGGYGNSIIRVESVYESCLIFLVGGVSVSSLLGLRLQESDAVIRGVRRKGILPTQIDKDNEGHLGCVAGWIILRSDDNILIVDGASIGFGESAKTFAMKPENWWKCINDNEKRRRSAWKMTSIDAFRNWSERVYALIHSIEATEDLLSDMRRVGRSNRRVLEKAFCMALCGDKLRSRLPSNVVNLLRFVDGGKGGTANCKIGGRIESYDLKEAITPSRNQRILLWWVGHVASMGCKSVVFLPSVDCASSATMINCDAPIAESDVNDILSRTRLTSPGVDHVAFASTATYSWGKNDDARCQIPCECVDEMLVGLQSVILGVCNGTAWAEAMTTKNFIPSQPHGRCWRSRHCMVGK